MLIFTSFTRFPASTSLSLLPFSWSSPCPSPFCSFPLSPAMLLLLRPPRLLPRLFIFLSFCVSVSSPFCDTLFVLGCAIYIF